MTFADLLAFERVRKRPPSDFPIARATAGMTASSAPVA